MNQWIDQIIWKINSHSAIFFPLTCKLLPTVSSCLGQEKSKHNIIDEVYSQVAEILTGVGLQSESWTYCNEDYNTCYFTTANLTIYCASVREVRATGVSSDVLTIIGSLCVWRDRRISWHRILCGGGLAVGRGCSWNNHSPKHSNTGAVAASPSPLHPPIT